MRCAPFATSSCGDDQWRTRPHQPRTSPPKTGPSAATPGGSLNGYTDPARRQIILSADLSPEHTAKTLIHETAHILLGHTDNLADYAHHRGLAETEAESVAYVVAGLTGFDTSSYSIGYIAGWADADSTLITSTATRVLHTVHTIANILELDPAAIPAQ